MQVRSPCVTIVGSHNLPGSCKTHAWLSNKRRGVLVAGGAWPMLKWAGAVLAQSKKPPVLIGWMEGGSRATNGHFLMAFKEGLAALGWKEGVQYTIEERWANGNQALGPSLAQELAAKTPAVIVAAPMRMVEAAAKTAPDIPIVQANGESPVNRGLAKSLARPEGMVTGVTNMHGTDDTVVEKYLEMLLLAIPKMRRVGYLVDTTGSPPDTYKNIYQRVADKYKVEARFAFVSKVDEFETAFARLREEKIEGLVLQSATLFASERPRIAGMALNQRWPTVAGQEEYARAGALLSYGASRSDLYRRAASHVDKILKGAKPGDLPIEQPMRFELVINNKTAKALGLQLSLELLARADRVIE